MSKKKIKIPCRKRMSRKSRMQHVKDTKWLEMYEGKNIVKGYCKWFRVDEICAFKEIELLGYQLTEIEKQKAENAMEDRKMQLLKKKANKEKKKQEEEGSSGDDTFFFIAGHTESGVPYGITHEEMAESGNCEIDQNNWYIPDKKLPF